MVDPIQSSGIPEGRNNETVLARTRGRHDNVSRFRTAAPLVPMVRPRLRSLRQLSISGPHMPVEVA